MKRFLLTKEEAQERGMIPHAGPFNMRLEALSLGAFLHDFRQRPERKFALVETVIKTDTNKPLYRVVIYADGQSDVDETE